LFFAAFSVRPILQSGSFAPHPLSTRIAAPGMAQRSVRMAGCGVLPAPVCSTWPRLSLPALCLCGGWLELCCPRRQPHLIAILVGPPPPSPQSLASPPAVGHDSNRACCFTLAASRFGGGLCRSCMDGRSTRASAEQPTIYAAPARRRRQCAKTPIAAGRGPWRC